MNGTRQLALVVVTLAVVVSGCQAPGTDPEPTLSVEDGEASPGESREITDPVDIYVDGIPVDTQPGLIFERLERLLGGNVSAPEEIQSSSTSDIPADSVRGGFRTPSRFFDVVGFETGPVGAETFLNRVGNAITRSQGRIQLYVSPAASQTEVEMLLAHELTHYVQFQNSRQQTLAREIDRQTVDGNYVFRSLLEGTAVVTTDTYMREYGHEDTLNNPYYDREQRRYPPGHVRRWANSRYQVGTDYVQNRVDSLSDLDAIYEDPPTRSRALFDPDAGTPPALAIVESHDRERISTNRLGAAFLRFGLESHVDPARARTVVEGFGADSLYQFRSRPDTYGNYVWTTRWESDAAAARFEAALADYFDERANRTANGWRLSELGLVLDVRDAGADTRVLVVGSEAFVDQTVISGREGAVSIDSG